MHLDNLPVEILLYLLAEKGGNSFYHVTDAHSTITNTRHRKIKLRPILERERS